MSEDIKVPEVGTAEVLMPSAESSSIKVIGVGGGGCNAVNHMFDAGIKGVSFLVCNTEDQALSDSPVANKILLGPNITKGLGAGNKPEMAQKAAEESLESIKRELEKDTKMVFVTAGMGGGTGTGAAPIVAAVAKGMGILTVGIVTIPFLFEGRKKIDQALAGVRRMQEAVDALLVINNERLCDQYPDLNIFDGFAKADDVLLEAARGIAEIIIIHGKINVDLADVTTIMRDSGVAVMNTGYASGENRVKQAIDNALVSPLLKNRDITNAQRILLNFYCKNDDSAVKMSEIKEVTEFMNGLKSVEQVIWGIAFVSEEELNGEELKIQVIATGFDVEDMVLPDSSTSPVEPVTGIPTSESVKETMSEADRKLQDSYEELYGDTNGVKKDQNKEAQEKFQNINDEKSVIALEEQPAFRRRVTAKPFIPKHK